MSNPRSYPDEITSAESGRTLRRGVKRLTITADGQPFSYSQPGWWASLTDPADTEGQLVDEDNTIRAAAQREAKARARHAMLSPLVIRAIREACGLSQRDAGRVFGGGPKAFEKYEAGEVSPSAAMARLLLLAARDPTLFSKGDQADVLSHADIETIRDAVSRSSVATIYQRIYDGPTRDDEGVLYSAALAVERDAQLAEEMAEWESATVGDGLRSPTVRKRRR